MKEATQRTEAGNGQLGSLRKLCKSLFLLAIPLALSWLGLYAAWRRLPYLKPGSDVIYEAKANALAEMDVFSPRAKLRVVAVGNSITLAGFVPEQFDAQVGNGCESYNLGLPGKQQYMEELRAMIGRGDVPTHVLMQLTWPTTENKPSLRSRLKEDDRIIHTLFPFRTLPRDLAIFTVLSRGQGGFRALYQQKQGTASQMLTDRGYYFIEGQSRHKGHRLPEGLTFQTDKPDKPFKRQVSVRSLAFRELQVMAKQHGIQFLLIPSYFRTNCFGPAPDQSKDRKKLSIHPAFGIIGPDYYHFDNKFFSDSVHVNRDGAELYTKRITELFISHMEETAKDGGTD